MNNPEQVARGNRIKSVRMLCGLTRKGFASFSKISIPTLRSWEEPEHSRNGLTQKGAQRLSEAFYKYGIICTAEWLYWGKGFAPKIIDAQNNSIISIENEDAYWSDDEAIIKDVEAFKIHNKDSIVSMVQDTAMLPFFCLGDFVGGQRFYDKQIESLIGLNCIIESTSDIFIRKIVEFISHNIFIISSLNYRDPVLQRVAIDSAAEIIWHRKRATVRHIPKQKVSYAE